MCCCFIECKKAKIISLFCLLFLIITIIAFVIIKNINPEINRNILATLARVGDNTQAGNVIISFSENQIVEGSAISHTPGSSEIVINEDGLYQISYQLTGVDQGTGRFNFNAILLVNNIPQNDTLNEGAVLSEDIVNNRYTLTSTVILRLSSGDTLELGALSLEEVQYPNARVDIEKIG